MTIQEEEQHARLVAYLLGRLTEPEQEALAERYFADDELFDELRAVEAELLDQYVRGQLSPADREAFRRHLQHKPGGRHELAVAVALRDHLAEELPEPALENAGQDGILSSEVSLSPGVAHDMSDSSESRRRWRAFLPALFAIVLPRPLALRYALWAGLALLGGGLTLLYFNRELRRENATLQALSAARASEQQRLRRQSEDLNQQLAEERRRAAQLQGDLERAKQQSTAPTPGHSPAPSGFVALALTSAARSTAPSDQLILTSGAEFIALTLPIDGKERYTGYRARLRTTENQFVWQQEWRQPRPASLGRTLVLHIPAHHLPADTYKLTLELTTPNEVIAPDYYFTIVRR